MTSLVTVKKEVEKIREIFKPKERKHLLIYTWEGCFDLYDAIYPPDHKGGKRDCKTCTEKCHNPVRSEFLAKRGEKP